MDQLFKFLQEHFLHVAPILTVGIAAVLICSERTRALLWKYPLLNTGDFFSKIQDMVMKDQITEAINFCDRYPNKLVAIVCKAALHRAHQPENMIEDALRISVGEAMAKTQKRTPFLATIANVSTLLGLFGTILGLITSFEAVGAAEAQMRSQLLAQGISAAMNATMMGLGVAIPCMIMYAYLTNVTNKINADIDRAAMQILDTLKQRYYASEDSGDQRSA